MKKLAVGLVFFLISIFLLQGVGIKKRGILTGPIPGKDAALLMSGEFKQVIADYFLFKAAVFYGEAPEKMTLFERKWLAEVIDLSSFLDPYYLDTYWMAGVILPWEGQAKRALGILERGLTKRPDSWEIPFYMGFINFYFLKNYIRAARYFFDASRIKGAPAYLPLLASRLATKGGDVNMAITLLEESLKIVNNKALARKIQKRIKALERNYDLN